jgi:rhodanese-related sulfurtransferase
MRFTRLAIVTATMLAMALAACSSSDGGGGAAANGGPGWTRLSPTELQQMLEQEDVYLVNVHVPYEGDIPGTDASISYAEIASRVAELPTSGDPKLVIYCRSGNMSTQAAQELIDAGVSGFYELEGGFIAWNEAGLPFEAP